MAIKHKKGKKAMFFSLIAVLIGAIFAISFEVMRERHFEENKLSSTKTRVEVLNNFVNDLDDRYFERMLYVSSKAALQSLGEYRKDNALPNGLNTDFKSAVLDGKIKRGAVEENLLFPCSIGGSPTTCEMEDYALNKFLTDSNNIFKTFGVETNKMKIEIMDIRQTGPWHAVITAKFKYAFKDDSNIASWEGETTKTVSVNINGIYGPNTAPENGVIRKDDNWISAPSCFSFLKRLAPTDTTISIGNGIKPNICENPETSEEECCNPS